MRRVVLSCVLVGACNAFPDNLRSEIPVEHTLTDSGASTDGATSVDSGAEDGSKAVDAPATATLWPENGHAYEVVRKSGSLTFDGARLNAEENGGHLVTIGSLAESSFVRQLMSERSVSQAWIGAYQTSKAHEPSGDWAWVTGEPWEFTRWASGEPSNNDDEEDFALALSNGEWNDTKETGSFIIRAYVVEYE